MIRYMVLILPVVTGMLFVSCDGKKRPDPQLSMIEADVSYISQRCNVMVWPSGNGYEENNALYADGMKTVMQNMTFYRPSGEVYMFLGGAAMGMVPYADGKPGVYLPLEEKHQLRIEIDLAGNYLIDIHQYGTDTIKDPVILPDQKMILSADNYRIFREQTRLPEKRRSTKQFTFYRYK